MLDSSKTCAYSAFIVRQTHVVHVFVDLCFPACLIKIKTIRNVLPQVKKRRKRRHVFNIVNVRNSVCVLRLMLNFEIVSSIGSSARYGRISQQEEISYSFVHFVTHSFARRLYCAGQT
jgi:hypothetical protein